MITDDEIKAARALCEVVHVEHDPEDHYEYLSIGFVDSDGNETLELTPPSPPRSPRPGRGVTRSGCSVAVLRESS